MTALWHRLTAPWRRRREVRREDLARWDRTEEQVLEMADELEAWRKAKPGETPAACEPDDDLAEDPYAYVGRHRAIGAGWGAPPVPSLTITVPPIDWRARTGEWELQLATWAADLGEPVRPVRGQVTFAEVTGV